MLLHPVKTWLFRGELSGAALTAWGFFFFLAALVALLVKCIPDPEFDTPVALELGIQVIFAAPFVFSLMMLMHAPLWWGEA